LKRANDFGGAYIIKKRRRGIQESNNIPGADWGNLRLSLGKGEGGEGVLDLWNKEKGGGGAGGRDAMGTELKTSSKSNFIGLGKERDLSVSLIERGTAKTKEVVKRDNPWLA